MRQRTLEELSTLAKRALYQSELVAFVMEGHSPSDVRAGLEVSSFDSESVESATALATIL